MSRLLFNHSGIAADAFGHLLGLSRLLTGDVIEGFQVQAKATPNMSVTVGQGSAGISSGTYPDNFRYWIANDTTSGSPAGESVTITTASSSNPRIDTIVAYVNESGSFSTSPVNQPGGWTAAAVAGTPASSPSAPSGATIQSAIGAGNPYIVLANVLVGTSVTQINSGNITDLRSFASTNTRNSYNPYKFRVFSAGAQNTTAGAFARVNCDTRTYDTSSSIDITTNKGRFTAPVAGFYSFSGAITSNLNGAAVYGTALFKNGTAHSLGTFIPTTTFSNTGNTTVMVSDTLSLATNDYVELQAFCSAPVPLITGSSNTYFSGTLVSAT